MRWLWLLGILSALGCRSSQTPKELPQPRSPVATATAHTSSSAPIAAAPKSSAPWSPAPLPDGCFNDLPFEDDSEHLLAELAAKCAAGMRPTSAPQSLELGSNKTQAASFAVEEATRCLRALAVSSSERSELGMQVLDDEGRLLAENTLPSWFALGNPQGPFCLSEATKLRLVVTNTGPQAKVLLQLWQADEK